MRTSRDSILKAILLTTAALAIANCGRRPVYSHFEPVSTEGWNKSDTLCFMAPVSDGGLYNITMGLRANSTYPYTNIAMSVDIRTSKTGKSITSLVSLDITDEDGNMQGSGLGTHQMESPLPSIDTEPGDTLTVLVAHNMSRRTLPGITDIGITIGK